MEIRKDQVIDEDFIADVRNKFKIAFFLYKRKKSRWVTLYQKVMSLIEEPKADIDPEYLRKKNLKIEEMELKSRPNNTYKLAFYRFLSVFIALISLIVLITQSLALFKPDYSPIYYVSLSI